MDKSTAKRQKLAQAEKFKFVYNIERSDAPGINLIKLGSFITGSGTVSVFCPVRYFICPVSYLQVWGARTLHVRLLA